MKKIAYYILPLLAVGTLFTSCDDEEYRNPTEVVDAYIGEHLDLLTSSQLGWRFDYSPNEEQYGVYTFLMDFDENGRVSMLTDRDFYYLEAKGDDLTRDYKAQQSDYTIQNSQGPVLTFSTYSLLTKLADPELNVSGYGWDGENDFIIMGHSATKDTIYLKSLKAQKNCFLVKNTMEWDDYFEKVNSVIEKFTTGEYSNTFFRDIEVVGTHGTDTAVMTDFSMATRMGVVYQKKDNHMITETCRFRFTPEGVMLEKPITIGEDTEVTHFSYDENACQFLVNGQAGSTITMAENGRPKMIFPVKDKVFKGIFEEVMDGVAIERDDMYQLDIHPEDCNDEWLALSQKIKNYLYMLIMPGNNKTYYIGLYAQLSDEKGQMHYVGVQCQINYSWSPNEDDVIVFRGFASNQMYFIGMDTESGEWDVNTPLATQFKEDVQAEFTAYLSGIFGTGNRDKKECVVVPSPDGTYFSFVNKETGGYLGMIKAY